MRSSLRALCVLPVVVLPAVGHAPASAQVDGGFAVAMTRLELTLDLDYEEGSLAGTASYELANLSAVAVTDVPFNLGRLLTVRSARGPSGETLAFGQDVAVFEDSPRRQVNHVVVTLPDPLAAGETIRVRLDYGGYLVGYTETGSIYIKDRVAPDFSILREDALAWPSLGTLSRRANRMAPRPDFTFTARITVPEGQTVASGGRLVERTTRQGRTTFTYESVAPVPFLNLPIAPYALLSDQGVRVYFFPEDSVGARRVLASATRGLELLERWFGPLGTTPDLAVMEIPEVWGSQASLSGGIIQTADAFRDPNRMTALYHELSHLWNAPDADQPSARWNEGLATFLSERMAAELDGRNRLTENVARTASRLISSAEINPVLAEVPFLRYGEAGATDLSYRVGFLMFYALFETLGAERLDAALGGYYQDHRERGGTFLELLGRIQTESPRDLDGFFDTWVHTTGWLDELRAGTPVERIGI